MPVLLLSHSIENTNQHSNLRDELLNTKIFYTLKKAVGSRTYNGSRITYDAPRIASQCPEPRGSGSNERS